MREYEKGVQIVADYVETMREDDPLGRPWHAGGLVDGYVPPLTVPVAPPLVFAVVDPPAAGVIAYDIWDMRAPVLALGGRLCSLSSWCIRRHSAVSLLPSDPVQT